MLGFVDDVTQATPARRIQRLTIAPAILFQFLKMLREPQCYSVEGIPADAVFVGSAYDDMSQNLALFIESESFQPIRPGMQMLEMQQVQLTQHATEKALVVLT